MAAPFLNRLDLRMRYAMDRSDAAHLLRRTEIRSERLAASLDQLSRTVAGLKDAMAQTQSVLSAQQVAVQAVELQLRGMSPKLSELASTATQTQAGLRTLERHVTEANAVRQESTAVLETRYEWLNRYIESLLQRNVIPLGRELAVRTDAGYLLVPVEDPALLVALVETRGRVEPGTVAVLRSLLPKGGVFIDVGANVGSVTLPAARHVGTEGRVLALEPAPRVADLLRRTIVLNEMSSHVDVQECAAFDVEGRAPFGLSAKTTHNSLWPPDDAVQMIEVAVHTLDSLVPPGSGVHAVKIDAEGAELKVWRGMRRIVSDNPELAIVLEFGPEHIRRSGSTVPEWLSTLTALGHTVWEIDEASGAVRPLQGAGPSNGFSCNVLLTRDHPATRGIPVA